MPQVARLSRLRGPKRALRRSTQQYAPLPSGLMGRGIRDPADDRALMQRAITLARQCESESGKVSPKVGAVVARDGVVIGEAFRRCRRPPGPEQAKRSLCPLSRLRRESLTAPTQLQETSGGGQVPRAEQAGHLAAGEQREQGCRRRKQRDENIIRAPTRSTRSCCGRIRRLPLASSP